MFKKTTEDSILPTRATKYSSAVDVYANEDVTIGAGETKMISLGIAIDLDMNAIDINFNHYVIGVRSAKREAFMSSHYLQLMLRSSPGKKGLILPNGVGVIDMDYKDEIKMIIHNPVDVKEYVENGHNYTVLCDSDDVEYTIKKGDRVGQIILLEHKSYLFGIESEEERKGGIGSTGV